MVRRGLMMLGLMLAVAVPVCGEDAATLNPRDRINGATTLKAFDPVAERVRPSVVRVMADGRQIGLGVVVGAEGFILTREVPADASLGVVLWDGRGFRAKQAATDAKNHLTLLKVAARGLRPVVWAEGKGPALGTWVVTPLVGGTGKNAGGSERVGIISAARRPIAREGGALGVLLGANPEGGAVIEKVVPESGAARAGLQPGDRVTAVNGARVLDIDTLRSEVRLHDAGETIRLRIVRAQQEMSIEVKLGDRSAVFDAMDRNMQMSKGRSKVRSGFEAVIEHDTPLEDRLAGGPLVDLEGRAVGMNVARFDRSQTFAIPADVASRIAKQLMLEDAYRHPEPVEAYDITGGR